MYYIFSAISLIILISKENEFHHELFHSFRTQKLLLAHLEIVFCVEKNRRWKKANDFGHNHISNACGAKTFFFSTESFFSRFLLRYFFKKVFPFFLYHKCIHVLWNKMKTAKRWRKKNLSKLYEFYFIGQFCWCARAMPLKPSPFIYVREKKINNILIVVTKKKIQK